MDGGIASMTAAVFYGSTYVDLLPLADVSDESGEPEEADEREELGQAEDPEGAAGVQDLEALGVLLRKMEKDQYSQDSTAGSFNRHDLWPARGCHQLAKSY